MFVTERENSQAIINFLKEKKSKNIAVAFIGAGLSDFIQGKATIICNLTSGATNPYEVEALLANPAFRVKNNSALHAKVLFSKAELIVGSANMSTNGVGLRAESAAWIEASLISKNTALIKQARSWFDLLWEQSDEIIPEMLMVAKIAYNRNEADEKGIIGKPMEGFYCVLYKNDRCSRNADDLMKEEFGKEWMDNGYGIYEDWGEPIPQGTLIDFHVKRKKLTHTGIWKNDGYSIQSKGIHLQIVKVTGSMNIPVKEITRLIEKKIDFLWPGRTEEGGIVLPLNKILSSASVATVEVGPN